MHRTGLQLSGPVGHYAVHLPNVCEESVGHTHHYDHSTVVIGGRLRVKYRYAKDGKLVEGESRDFGPGEVVPILADVHHTIKALEPNTFYLCVFSHRDFNGLVVERYGPHCTPLAYEVAPCGCGENGNVPAAA